MGVVVEKRVCPQCSDSGRDSSGDNLAVYEDGSTYCFACGYFTNEENKMKTGVVAKPEGKLIHADYMDLPNRRISKSTCEYFGYGVSRVDDGVVHVANYKDEYGRVIAQKIRNKDKKMWWTGDGKNPPLYGMWNYVPNENTFITIVEGELDALSVAQAQGLRYPVVSVPTGANGAKEAIKNHYEYLNGFKYIVLAFDNDEAGRKAMEECVPLFEPGRIKVATWPKKDASDSLVAGRPGEIKDTIFSARLPTVDNILWLDDLLDSLPQPERGLSWPWETMTRLTYGVRVGELYTIGGGSGCGKSTWLLEMLTHLVTEHKKKVGTFFLEQKPADTALRLIGGRLGQRLHIPGVEWDLDLMKKTVADLNGMVSFYNGKHNAEEIFQKIIYLHRVEGIQYFIIDHLTALAATMSSKVDELDLVMSRLGDLIQKYEITIFLVSHLSAPPNGETTYEEGRPVTARAFRGSQAIQYWSSFMLGLERNKLSEDEDVRHQMKIRVLKDRFSGESDGHVVHLTYDVDSGRLVETEDHELRAFKEI